MIEVKITGTVNRPLKDLWKLTVLDFDKVGTWATGVYNSKKGVDHDRVCETPFGKLYENISLKDEEDHKIEVDANGFPFFVRKATGHWSFREVSNKKTDFTFGIKLDTMPVIGSIMSVFMRPKLTKALEITAKDYKTFLETGEVSKLKKEELEGNK